MASKIKPALALLSSLLISQSLTTQKTYIRWRRANYIVGGRQGTQFVNNSPAIGIFEDSPSKNTFTFKIYASKTGFLFSDFGFINSYSFPKKITKVDLVSNSFTMGADLVFYEGKRARDISYLSNSYISKITFKGDKYKLDYDKIPFDIEKISFEKDFKISTESDGLTLFKFESTGYDYIYQAPATVIDKDDLLHMKPFAITIFMISVLFWVILLKKNDGKRIPIHTLLMNSLTYILVCITAELFGNKFVSIHESGYNILFFNLLPIFGGVRFFTSRNSRKETKSIAAMVMSFVYYFFALFFYYLTPDFFPFFVLFQYITLIVEHFTVTKNRYNLLTTWALITLQQALLMYIHYNHENSAMIPLIEFERSAGVVLLVFIFGFSILIFILACVTKNISEENEVFAAMVNLKEGLSDVSLTNGISQPLNMDGEGEKFNAKPEFVQENIQGNMVYPQGDGYFNVGKNVPQGSNEGYY